MANQYFVFKKLPELGEEFIIEDQAAAHHIFTVMRAKSGDQIRLVFTDGEIGLSEVVSPSDQSVKLIKLLTESSELPVQITVAVGFPKGDKLDFIVEKSTELGATAIWSAPFKASVSKWDKKKLTKKQEKLEKVALGAAEQSRRQMIPELQLFEQFTDLLDKFSDFDQVLIAYEESAKMGEKTNVQTSTDRNVTQPKSAYHFWTRRRNQSRRNHKIFRFRCKNDWLRAANFKSRNGSIICPLKYFSLF
ncbi:RNA methyltransferase, RsmE family [Lactococcus lactis subsp. lactis]|nr:RNA methyltransferase, RsmE family [Lactococcus lactis subsp. lactis]